MDNVDSQKFDVTESLESWVVAYYKGKNYTSNVTTIPQMSWYLYSKLQSEFNKLSSTKAILKYKTVRSYYVT